MPRQLDSISSRSDSRHAFSCGESTSTPSTSKIAPWNFGMWLLSVPAFSSGGRPAGTGNGRRVLAEFEHGLFARAQLTDVTVGSDPDGTAHALGLYGQGQAIA